MQEKIKAYLKKWGKQDYFDGIPDEVPQVLMKLNLAPSWKALAIAILKNDHNLSSLGFTAPESLWYGELKRIELSKSNPQQRLFT